MKKTYSMILLFLVFIACKTDSVKTTQTGTFVGHFKYGNFADTIKFEIEQDSTKWNTFFTSLEQNANRIPFQNIEVKGDSINFKLQSDFHTYYFKNKWVDNNTKLDGVLRVDTLTVHYVLEKEISKKPNIIKSKETSFESNGLHLKGTIWYPENSINKALVIVASSGNADRSASRAEAILFSQMGFTTFHYDKRGTGRSDGDWVTSTIEELASDDINAIKYFSTITDIPITNIGIKGSSQGGAKIPYILNQLVELNFGITVSCPGVSLLESDLNYWKNRNSELLEGHLIEAATLQQKVYKYIAGTFTRPNLELAIKKEKTKTWFNTIWIPNLDDVQIDKKLLYSPIPYFEKTTQPILIIQGTLDEIIPTYSYKMISNAITKANNTQQKIVLLEGASHSMYFVGDSDFPYWSKLHPNYITTIKKWVSHL